MAQEVPLALYAVRDNVRGRGRERLFALIDLHKNVSILHQTSGSTNTAAAKQGGQTRNPAVDVMCDSKTTTFHGAGIPTSFPKSKW